MDKIEALVADIKKNAITHGSLPFWSWNDKLEPEELRRQIRVMKELGMNGFFMHARCGLVTDYLSDEWFECVGACIDEAKKLGMEAWSYDENGWPSGFAGGALLEERDNLAGFLRMESTSEYPCGENVLGAYRIVNGALRRLDASDGGEYLVIYEERDPSYIDALDPAVTKKFLRSTHEEYKARIAPEDFGTVMPGFFTDEPQYYRLAPPYSKLLPEAFESEYGYSVFDALPALFVDFDGAEQLRHDYYRLAHRMFINNFIKPVHEWSEENGCRITGHAIEEASLSGQMWCCGGVMPFYEYEDIPGIDYLGRGLAGDLASKQLGSVCAQLGKKKAISEMFACCGWDVTPLELRRIAEIQYVNGVNMMCQHLYSYTERGQRKRDYPVHFSEHNPWQFALADFDRYFNNLGYTLSLGEEYATTLVIHPIHSAWMRYKRPQDANSIAELQDSLFGLVERLSGSQIPYHFGDECMMERLASVEREDGKVYIRIGRCRYENVVLPLVYTLDSSTAALLREFTESGGRLCLYAEPPYAIDGRIADCSWLRSNVTLDEIREAAAARLTVGSGYDSRLRMAVRLTEQGRIVYIINRSDDAIDNIMLELDGADGAVMLDMNDLTEHALVTAHGEGGLQLRFALEKAGSVVIVERSGAAAQSCGDTLHVKRYDGATVGLPERWRLTEKPKNMMTLDYARLSYDGVSYTELLPVPCIKERLYRERYEGRLWMKYEFNAEYLPQDLTCVVEPMHGLGVSVGGNELSADGDWWYDRTFKCYPIGNSVQPGRTEIIVSFDYFQSEHVYYVLFGGVSETLRNCLVFDTEIENIYLTGSFCVRSDSGYKKGERETLLADGDFTLTEQRDTVLLSDITGDGYPFYGGTVTAECSYTWHEGEPTVLRLDGRYALACVSVNGRNAGTLMFNDTLELAPYLHDGENTVGIRITNAVRNLIGPHHCIDPEPLVVSPGTFSFEGEWKGDSCPEYRDRYAFVRFGARTV